jgi:demethylmenaquinone methyltransferase/2-methoxy-6-polyprenyl-1,4-benzoquinol methylase
MLRLGRVKARKLARRMPFLCGDAEHLPFPDGTFQAAVAAFGVRNLADVDAGLREIRRALCPGGRVAILEFSRPRSMPARGLYLLYFRHVLPGIGRIVSGHPDAYRYLFESVAHFGRDADLTERLRGTGFVGVAEYPLTGGIATLYVGSRPPIDKA